jgi:hypothetical protein
MVPLTSQISFVDATENYSNTSSIVPDRVSDFVVVDE